MSRNQWWRTSCAFIATVGFMQPTAMFAAEAQAAQTQAAQLTIAPRSSAIVAAHVVQPNAEPNLTSKDKFALLRQKVKYVFVLFQENRSFDQHFGTFPGADGLFPVGSQPGYVQKIVNTDDTVSTISPFLIPQTIKDTNGNSVALSPADTDSVDHSHAGIVNSIDTVNGVTQNDRFALNEEGFTTDSNGNIVTRSTGAPYGTVAPPTLLQKQRAELVMSHLDCDTIPFLWQYADRFTLLDNFRMTVTGPSTPNALALIAGQSGVTQWALHPEQGSNNTGSPVVQASGGEPVVGDPGPFAGSNLDTSPIKPPYNPGDENPAKPALNQTYASLPLSFMGSNIDTLIQFDENPALDLLDVQDDIKTISHKNMPVNWGWYQEGYDHEPTDGSGPATYATYIVHHNGPQYFGYVGDNPKVASKLHGLGDFFTNIGGAKLGAPGVFYVRGGYGNNDGLVPVDKNAAVQAAFTGSDDHPGYSDAQIAEALLADEINAIASSRYWKDSAIIITYDETDGLYDHVPATIRATDPFGAPLMPGSRIPTIVISPYSSVHAISHRYSEHASVIKFIDKLFNLVPLEKLPDEQKGRALGASEFGQSDLTPVDAESYIGDLTEAFDNARLSGTVAPLPASYAMIDPTVVHTLPHYGSNGCYTLNIIPTDYRGGQLLDPPPADFNPRPGTTPGLPTQPGWGG